MPPSLPNSYAQTEPTPFSERQKSRDEKQSRLAAILTTVLIHLIVFAALAWVILNPSTPEAPTIVIESTEDGTIRPDRDPKRFTDRVTKDRPVQGHAQLPPIRGNPVRSDVNLITVETDPNLFSDGSWGDFGAGFDGVGRGRGISGIRPEIRGRCNQADRAKRLRENGGTVALDRQVVAALDWLQAEQNADGSWGTAYPVAMTGFALLAFSGHCETIDSPDYGATVIKAIEFLIKQSRSNNGLMSTAPGQHAPYEHGIATYALAEAFSLNMNARAKCERIAPALRNAVPIIIEWQTKGGGWLYSYRQNGVGDLSISGWNIQALKAAEMTGIRFTGIEKTKERALAYLKIAAVPNGLYRYRITDQHQGRIALAGVGVLCGRMLGEEMAHEDESLAAILADHPRSFKSADPYALYYHSQACFQKGGDTWKRFNAKQQKLIIDAQEKDGSWPVASGHIGAAQADAKVYHTCLCALMLEVYYRYLPATAKTGW